MLKSVHLSNFAIASDVALELESGMTAITGETGAGKSIMVDALKLICGQRAEEGLIKEGCDQSVITANFDVAKLPLAQAFVKDLGIDDDDLILRRVLRRGGRSKNSINGQPVNLSEMEALSQFLLDICGQHSHIQLLNRRHQMLMLDRIGSSINPAYGPLLQSVAGAFNDWKAAKDKLQATLKLIDDSHNQRLLLSYHLEELEKLEPVVGEFEDMSQEHAVLERADDDEASFSTALAKLDGDGHGEGLSERIGSAVGYLEELSERYTTLKNSIDMLNNAKVEVTEAISEINSAQRSISNNPQRCAELSDRMGEYFRLAKKHQIAPDELAKRFEEVQYEIENLPTADDIEPLEQAVAKAEAEFKSLAATLRTYREEAGAALADKITTVLHQIGLNKSRVEFQVTDAAPNELGADALDILFSANVGQSLKSLSKVASGGELSRVALAFQVVEADYAALPTMVFDEIDVGIGGDAARRVGDMLARLGDRGQCMVITHQAPVAKAARNHMLVEKNHGETETTTALRKLAQKERDAEIIRMTGIDA